MGEEFGAGDLRAALIEAYNSVSRYEFGGEGTLAGIWQGAFGNSNVFGGW